MALSELRFFSHAIGKMTAAMVLLPENPAGEPPYPVLYLLHGRSDDYTAWTRKSRVEYYAEQLPLIVVMPDTARGWYTDARDGYAYGTAIGQELPALIDRLYRTDARREGRVVAGLSMGGYGAFKLALTHPDLFRAAISHSGALAVGHLPWDPAIDPLGEYRRIFGTDPAGGPDDLFSLVTQLDRATLPALRFDCGVDDFLIQQNRDFHQHLETHGIPHEYEEFAGAHTWDYWDLHIQETLAYLARLLNLAR